MKKTLLALVATMAIQTSFISVPDQLPTNAVQKSYMDAKDRIFLNGPTDGNLVELFKNSDSIVVKYGMGGNISGMLQTLGFLKETPIKLSLLMDHVIPHVRCWFRQNRMFYSQIAPSFISILLWIIGVKKVRKKLGFQ